MFESILRRRDQFVGLQIDKEGGAYKVLDVGSGHQPYRYANVLCDLYAHSTNDRVEWIVLDRRPFIRCDGQHLPFKDKIFDFVNCSHVMEHVENPAKLFQELRRVARRGRIITPNRLAENGIFANKTHKWIIFKRGNKLYYSRIRHNPLRLGFLLNFLQTHIYLIRLLIGILDLCFPHALNTIYFFEDGKSES